MILERKRYAPPLLALRLVAGLETLIEKLDSLPSDRKNPVFSCYPSQQVSATSNANINLPEGPLSPLPLPSPSPSLVAAFIFTSSGFNRMFRRLCQ